MSCLVVEVAEVVEVYIYRVATLPMGEKDEMMNQVFTTGHELETFTFTAPVKWRSKFPLLRR
jgi:hypothetical protein